MEKNLPKWKSLNKKALNLSLICLLNWLIKIIVRWQFLITTTVCFGFLLQILLKDVAVTNMNIIFVVMAIVPSFRSLSLGLDRFTKHLTKNTVLSLLLSTVFQIKVGSDTFGRTFNLMLISLVIYLIVRWLQPIIFEKCLFKYVIHKAYLGIRKTTDALPPEPNLFKDADEKDANKRMQVINQNVIKAPYQDVVELSFLTREVVTAIQYEAVSLGKKLFIDEDTIYHPVFTLFPFGKQYNFYFKLITFRLSRRDAFTATGTRPIKK